MTTNAAQMRRLVGRSIQAIPARRRQMRSSLTNDESLKILIGFAEDGFWFEGLGDNSISPTIDHGQ